MKQSLLHADFDSALNILDKKYFKSSKLDEGRHQNSDELMSDALTAAVVFVCGTFAACIFTLGSSYFHSRTFQDVFRILVWTVWTLAVIPYLLGIATKFLHYRDYGQYFFRTSVRNVCVCTCWGLVSFIAAAAVVMDGTEKWEVPVQLVVAGICLLLNVPYTLRKWRMRLEGRDDETVFNYSAIICGAAYAALLIYNLRFAFRYSGSDLDRILAVVIGYQGIIVAVYFLLGLLVFNYSGHELLVSWYARMYPEQVRQHFGIPVTRWYYSRELMEKYGGDVRDLSVMEKLESVKVDNYDIFEEDILRIDDEDMKDEELLAGFDVAVGSNSVYLICTDRKLYVTFAENLFDMSVPEIAYSSLKWYDCRYLGIGLGYGVRVSDGELITSFSDIKKKAMQQLVSILEEHGVDKLVHQEVPEKSKVDGIPDEFAGNYQKAVAEMADGEKIIQGSRLEHDIVIDTESTYMILTDRRFIFVFGGDEFGIPYLGVDYRNLNVYQYHKILSPTLCLRNRNLFMTITGVTELWDKETSGYLMNLVNGRDITKDGKA